MIRGEKPFISCGFTVETRGFAKSGLRQEMSTGNTVHEVRLTRGASLTGKVLQEGKPVANAGIGITGVKADVFNASYYVATDDRGQFSFANIPPNRDYYLFGIMKSLKDRGSLSLRRVHVDGDGSVKDVGDLNLKPGCTVAGTVRLRNGEPAPKNCVVTLCLTVMTPPPAGES
ncbi:MAG: hypothetical protein KGR98_13785, partial [Verrucomicrobia bacterium]|nr:hypothetical protein [Verrucomicrobiota bacterium]